MTDRPKFEFGIESEHREGQITLEAMDCVECGASIFAMPGTENPRCSKHDPSPPVVPFAMTDKPVRPLTAAEVVAKRLSQEGTE